MGLLVLRMVEERFHRDLEGRPIRESRTPPEFLRDGDLELKACPYSGTRHGRPMNAGALRQTGAHWDEILDALGALRAAYGSGGELIDLWRIGQLASALPWHYILRGETCPAYASALAKAAQGVGIWAQRSIVRTIAEPWRPPTLTAAAILELAEASGTLVGNTEACAGSDRMLLAFFEVLTGEVKRGGPLPAGALELGAHYLQLKQLMWLLCLARRFAIADVGTPAARELLAAPIEPSDFFLIEPPDLAGTPRPTRGAWFHVLAQQVAPVLHDGSDGTYRELARRIAPAMAAPGTPHQTYAALDALGGELLAAAEAGFRRALGAAPYTGELDAAHRDRLVARSPRTLFVG
ncbi:MAG TPA: hypothetical protein VMJ10_07785 [Kofleriaceae bacterium]|nr:hypothetical protein [Kofleriaceae bacterium]